MRGIKKRTAFFLFGILGLLATSGALLGSTYTIQQSTLYPFKNSISVQDDFVSGVNGSGAIGTLGWNVAGTTSNLGSETNRIGLIRKDTSAVISTTSYLTLGGSSVTIDPANPHSITWLARLNTNDANTTIHLGASNSGFTAAPTHGIYFQKLDADTNWFCVTRAAGVQTRTDSGVAVTTSFANFSYTRNSSGVFFLINGVSVCASPITTNIPTTFLDPIAVIVNSAAAAKTFDVDYFQLAISGLVR